MSNYDPMKIEIKEENVLGNDYLVAKGRLKGVLQQLTERSDSDSYSSDDDDRRPRKIDKRGSKKQAAPFHHTFVMKLFDRSVDLARFQEDTPLYPICRAWMANQPRNPQPIVKRRLSSPEPDTWNGNAMSDVYCLPRPTGSFQTRCPSPLPEQLAEKKDNINLNYDENPPVSKDVLIKNHLQRWVDVKKKWMKASQKNEERYAHSLAILQAIYDGGQDNIQKK